MKTANKKKISKKKETKNGRKLGRETVSEISVFIRLRKKKQPRNSVKKPSKRFGEWSDFNEWTRKEPKKKEPKKLLLLLLLLQCSVRCEATEQARAGEQVN